MSNLIIVGSWVNGTFVPDEKPGRTEKQWNDVVMCEETREFFRLVENGRTGRFDLYPVTADVVTVAFFGQIHQPEWADVMVETRGGI